MSEHEVTFPDEFVWGAATAAYQIEGAAREDGRGPSIWDTFSHTPGKVAGGDTGDVACDHYHRWPEDIALMRELGLDAYRFSLAWPRILPDGTGAVNQQGLDFYDRLVDGLLAAGITPFATLYHWDLPQALQDQGGWANRATVDAFAHYADVVARHLGDRIKHWMTHNEPWVAAFMGHYTGEHAPGHTDFSEALLAAHHILLSHGRAVPVLRAASGPEAQVGIVLFLNWAMPATDSEADRAAARRQDGFVSRWFLDPLFKGEYPADMVKLYGDLVPDISPGDLATIRAPLDFLGINYYFRDVVRHSDQPPFHTEKLAFTDNITAMGWEIYPDGLGALLRRVARDYQPPAIYITENGAAFPDTPGPDGQVDDQARLAYLRDHLAVCHRAIQDGVPLRGYFVWSLLDNFEWAYGYDKRFGVVYVDYETQARTLKSSGRWYARVARNNGF